MTEAYDGNGNITEEKDMTGLSGITVSEAVSMAYGAANRLTSYNGLSSESGRVTYDADGNMITGPLNGVLTGFGYDMRNRLISAGDTTYNYDGEGNRISVNNGGNETVFITDPVGSLSNLLITEHPDGSRTVYVYGLGLISQEYIPVEGTTGEPEEYRLFHYDYRGSTTALTDKDGNVTDRMAYSPYGKMGERTGNTETVFLYVGQYGVQTDENGLYYMRARYYNTEISRWLSEDPIRDGLNYMGMPEGIRSGILTLTESNFPTFFGGIATIKGAS